ncbi:hypothetical protein SM124_09800 [Bacillus sp. 31A1R]|uniref:Double zinc ribbon n=1 Tax=Robertmurraya mangrovi TaxID=3098077 RepID=A0ABU5IXZ0_9BACI|nr:hypothetical protein [Bacillus sp. 31A1R]MDZ5472039.1 hypothetical protein [Bacillus sp. 31A1R]
MSFCKNCGNDLGNNKSFCTNCGQKIETIQVKKLFCNHCGEDITENGAHQCTTKLSPTIFSQTERKEKRLLISLSIFIFILISGGTGFFFYVKAASNPTQLINQYITALKSEDIDTLASLTIQQDTKKGIGLTAMQTLVEQLKEQPEILKNVEKNLIEQKDSLIKNNIKDTEPFIFKVTKKDKKKLLFVEQFEIVIVPVTLKLSIDSDAQLFINDREINRAEKSVRTMENLMPGIYTLKALKNNEFGHFEAKQTVPLWNSPTEEMELTFDQDYIIVENKYNEMTLYIDNEELTSSEPEIKIGPIPAGKKVTIQAVVNFPWGEVYSKKHVASAKDRVNPSFDNVYTEIESGIYESILNYNKSYVDAITYLDSSYLVNVSENKLEETLEIIQDLENRDIYYVGELNSLVFDSSTFTLKENDSEYEVKVNVEENYHSGWVKRGSEEEPDFETKKYYYTYTLKYDTYANTWNVTNTKKLKKTKISKPFVYRP